MVSKPVSRYIDYRDIFSRYLSWMKFWVLRLLSINIKTGAVLFVPTSYKYLFIYLFIARWFVQHVLLSYDSLCSVHMKIS